ISSSRSLPDGKGIIQICVMTEADKFIDIINILLNDGKWRFHCARTERTDENDRRADRREIFQVGNADSILIGDKISAAEMGRLLPEIEFALGKRERKCAETEKDGGIISHIV